MQIILVAMQRVFRIPSMRNCLLTNGANCSKISGYCVEPSTCSTYANIFWQTTLTATKNTVVLQQLHLKKGVCRTNKNNCPEISNSWITAQRKLATGVAGAIFVSFAWYLLHYFWFFILPLQSPTIVPFLPSRRSSGPFSTPLSKILCFFNHTL